MDITTIKKRLKFDKSTSTITRVRILRRIQRLADLIEERFSVRNVEQIQQKHCRYLLDWLATNYSDATRQDYIRSMVVMIRALQRGYWLAPLGLEKKSQLGGRPSRVAVVRSKSRLYL